MARIVYNHAALDRLLVSPSGPIAADLARRAVRVDRAAKQLCPVDTGRLRSSITWQIQRDTQGLLAVIGTNVEYARYVELGTIHTAAQPFLRPALGAAA